MATFPSLPYSPVPSESDEAQIARNLPASASLPTKHQVESHPNSHQWVAWGYEFASLLVPVLSLVAISITLAHYDRRTLPEWPLSITINSLLSIYGVIYKAALLFVAASCFGQLQWIWLSEPQPFVYRILFDDAVKGPWGAFALLWTQKLRQPLVLLGTVIVTAATVADPFVQALAQTSNCQVTISGQNLAVLPRTNRITGYTREYIQASLIDGIYNPGYQIGPPTQCATGNCTFGKSFITLGYSTSCDDISAEIHIQERSIPVTTASSFMGIQYHSTLPSGLNMTWDERALYSATESGPEIFAAEVSQNPNSEDPNLYIELLAGAVGFSNNSTVGVDSHRYQPFAARCTMKPCARILHTTVNNGRVQERLLQNVDQPWGSFMDGQSHYAGYYFALLDGACASKDEEDKNFLTGHGYDLQGPDRWLPFGAPRIAMGGNRKGDHIVNSYIRRLLDRECLYMINSIVIRGYLFLVLGGLVNGKLRSKITEFPPQPANSETFSLDNNPSGPLALQSIFSGGKINLDRVSSIFHNMTESLNWGARTYSDEGSSQYSKPVIGEATKEDTCLKAHWVYLTFPISLFVLTTGMLLWVIALTIHKGLPIWKSNPFPWHYRGNRILSDDQWPSGADEDPMVTTSDMEMASKDVMVSLSRGKNPHITRFDKDLKPSTSTSSELIPDQSASPLAPSHRGSVSLVSSASSMRPESETESGV